MNKETKQRMFLIAFGVVLFAMLTNLSFVIESVKKAVSLILPVLAGLIVAFVLSVPMNGFEKRITRIANLCGFKENRSAVTAISFILTLLSVILIFVLVFTIAIPELVSSVKSIIAIVNQKWPIWLETLRSYNIDTSYIDQMLKELDFANIIEKVMGGAGAFFGSVVDVSTSIVSSVTTGAISFVIAVYVLIGKKELGRQCKKVIYACFRETIAERICYIADIIRNTYTKFFSGQCVEAVILGTLIFTAFTICRLPYAGLIAILTGVFALIPYIGAFISCFVGTFLTLIYDPYRALLCLVVYLVVQFVENQFIYPHVVGGSIGLSPFWTLVAAVLGSNLFGILGMIFFIPLTAALSTLGREWINERIKLKGLKIK